MFWIEFQQNHGRVKITLDDGSVLYATMERADEPIEEGTPINKALFDSIKDKIVNTANGISKVGVFTPGSSVVTIECGFKPKFVFIGCVAASYTGGNFAWICDGKVGVGGGDDFYTSSAVTYSETGVSFTQITNLKLDYNNTFCYIAFSEEISE